MFGFGWRTGNVLVGMVGMMIGSGREIERGRGIERERDMSITGDEGCAPSCEDGESLRVLG